ncbi:hypothetical protein CRUP_025011, partial [Coryphaenoides rupestris]
LQQVVVVPQRPVAVARGRGQGLPGAPRRSRPGWRAGPAPRRARHWPSAAASCSCGCVATVATSCRPRCRTWHTSWRTRRRRRCCPWRSACATRTSTSRWRAWSGALPRRRRRKPRPLAAPSHRAMK